MRNVRNIWQQRYSRRATAPAPSSLAPGFVIGICVIRCREHAGAEDDHASVWAEAVGETRVVGVALGGVESLGVRSS